MENKKKCMWCDKTMPKSGIDRKNGTTLNNTWKTVCRKCVKINLLEAGCPIGINEYGKIKKLF